MVVIKRDNAPNKNYDIIEDDNERNIQELSDKIKALKNITIDIGNEVKLHNTLLDELNSGMSHADSLLGFSMKKIRNLHRRSHHNVIVYVALFCLLFFLILYILSKF